MAVNYETHIFEMNLMTSYAILVSMLQREVRDI